MDLDFGGDPSKPDPDGYAIDRENVARYYFWSVVSLISFLGLCTFGVGLLFLPVYVGTIGRWLPGRQAGVLKYWLEGRTLRVDTGVYFQNRRSIPLDRVTDIVLSQGPLLRRFGLWTMHVHTTGTLGQAGLGAVLIGLREPEEVRAELLALRDLAVRRLVD